MKLNVGFIGFDGTESKRAIPAIHQVKEAEGIEGDMNVLLRSPHGRAKSMLNKFTRMCNVRAFLTDEKDRAAWEKVGAKIEGGYDDFFEESDLMVIGTPEGQELPNVEASIAHDCNMVLMGGAHRGDILNGLAEKKIGITERIREDLGREFFLDWRIMIDFSKLLQNWSNAPAVTQPPYVGPSWLRGPSAFVPFSETWIRERRSSQHRKSVSQCHSVRQRCRPSGE